MRNTDYNTQKIITLPRKSVNTWSLMDTQNVSRHFGPILVENNMGVVEIKLKTVGRSTMK